MTPASLMWLMTMTVEKMMTELAHNPFHLLQITGHSLPEISQFNLCLNKSVLFLKCL